MNRLRDLKAFRGNFRSVISHLCNFRKKEFAIFLLFYYDSDVDSLVANSTKFKSVKISEDIYHALRSEAAARKAMFGALFGIAWEQFMRLPENKRERLTRSAELRRVA